jgi:hypothetical protein
MFYFLLWSELEIFQSGIMRYIQGQVDYTALLVSSGGASYLLTYQPVCLSAHLPTYLLSSLLVCLPSYVHI